MKTFEEFIAIVEKVRNLQKAYFKTRDPKILQECKLLERYLDNLIISSKVTPVPENTLF